jgi:hypothetical protein
MEARLDRNYWKKVAKETGHVDGDQARAELEDQYWADYDEPEE